MPYHVYMFEPYERNRMRGHSYHFKNFAEDELQTRVVDRWDVGQPITWDGETANSMSDGMTIKVFWTDQPIPDDVMHMAAYTAMSAGEERTNQWITGPPGALRTVTATTSATPSPLKDPRRVLVVHGRNLAARNAMFTFLRTLGLAPIEWEEAIRETGMGSPHNLEAVRAAMEIAQAVVVVLTAEDQAGLLPDLADGDDDQLLRGQPRQNVVMEAGMAMGVAPTTTILVELGDVRHASDFDGINVVRLTNAPGTRQALRSRLEGAGCALAEGGTDWTSSDAGGDFEGCVVGWEPVPPPSS